MTVNSDRNPECPDILFLIGYHHNSKYFHHRIDSQRAISKHQIGASLPGKLLHPQTARTEQKQKPTNVAGAKL